MRRRKPIGLSSLWIPMKDPLRPSSSGIDHSVGHLSHQRVAQTPQHCCTRSITALLQAQGIAPPPPRAAESQEPHAGPSQPKRAADTADDVVETASDDNVASGSSQPAKRRRETTQAEDVDVKRVKQLDESEDEEDEVGAIKVRHASSDSMFSLPRLIRAAPTPGSTSCHGRPSCSCSSNGSSGSRKRKGRRSDVRLRGGLRRRNRARPRHCELEAAEAGL